MQQPRAQFEFAVFNDVVGWSVSLVWFKTLTGVAAYLWISPNERVIWPDTPSLINDMIGYYLLLLDITIVIVVVTY